MIRVAFVVPDMGLKSGWRSMAKGIIQSLQGMVEPTIVTSQTDVTNVAKLFPDIRIITLRSAQNMSIRAPRTWGSLVSTAWDIQHSERLEVDLIHSLEAYPTGWIAQQLALRANVPYLLSLVGTYSVMWHRYPLDRRVYSNVLSNSAYLCSISAGTLEMVRKHFGKAISKVPTQVVLLGSNTWRDVPSNVALQRDPVQPPVMLSVGEVKPRKGHDVALAAFQIIQRTMPDVRYKIVGSTAYAGYYERLQTFVRENNLQHVEFLGYLQSDEELKKQYREASVFFLTPRMEDDRFEGFGLVYIEAGAYGLPVVGTRSGGITDAIKDNVTGLLVNPDDPEDAAKAVMKLLNDPELSKQMGTANRSWSETLTWERHAAEQYAIYQSVLAKNGASILSTDTP